MNMSLKSNNMCQEHLYIPPGLLLQWHITERCNLRCSHCYQEDYSGKELRFQELLVILRQYKDLLGFWRDKLGGLSVRGHITVTGGEPFVRRDFIDLLEVFSADRKHYSFAILTNGSFIDKPMARKLRKLGPTFVQLSIEGTQATHNKIRGSGNFDRTVSALKYLVGERIYTSISFTAHRSNFREFNEIARLGRKLRVARVWADRHIPWGTGSEMANYMLRAQETKEFIDIMYKSRNSVARLWYRRTEISMHRALQFLIGGGKPYHCTAGDTLITVQPNGDLYPCRRMPIRVGNLMEAPLSDLYYKNGFFIALRDKSKISDGCENCLYFKNCRGGLKCLSYAVAKDPFKADPGCWLASN
jgi:radical SAM protein with 4Fe4S-binding SPASM domain